MWQEDKGYDGTKVNESYAYSPNPLELFEIYICRRAWIGPKFPLVQISIQYRTRSTASIIPSQRDGESFKGLNVWTTLGTPVCRFPVVIEVHHYGENYMTKKLF
jgi:hypothetical protein